MPVIKPKELKKNLKALASGEAPGIFLIHGEELLVKTALEVAGRAAARRIPQTQL